MNKDPDLVFLFDSLIESAQRFVQASWHGGTPQEVQAAKSDLQSGFDVYLQMFVLRQIRDLRQLRAP